MASTFAIYLTRLPLKEIQLELFSKSDLMFDARLADKLRDYKDLWLKVLKINLWVVIEIDFI